MSSADKGDILIQPTDKGDILIQGGCLGSLGRIKSGRAALVRLHRLPILRLQIRMSPLGLPKNVPFGSTFGSPGIAVAVEDDPLKPDLPLLS
jgi:hypothetical protein